MYDSLKEKRKVKQFSKNIYVHNGFKHYKLVYKLNRGKNFRAFQLQKRGDVKLLRQSVFAKQSIINCYIYFLTHVLFLTSYLEA